MRIKLTAKKEVFNFCTPYVIAEIGANHNGDMSLAKEMIAAAKKSGADCVKFQSWTKDGLFSKAMLKNNPELEAMLDKFSISENQLIELKNFTDKIGIDLISTPFSNNDVDFLIDKLKAPFIKVASMDLNNYSFLEYIAKKNLPIVLSTGLSELYEIDKAIKTIENAGNNSIVILHCVSEYPPKDEAINLNNIETLQKIYPYPIGFSDHSLGFSVALAATAKGACVIEKHFTIDKELPGWDHKISACPEELTIICQESKKVNKALGEHRIVYEESNDKKVAFRRSAVAGRNIKAGESIDSDDVVFKRPGSGIPPEFKHFLVGRKAIKNIDEGSILKLEDLVS